MKKKVTLIITLIMAVVVIMAGCSSELGAEEETRSLRTVVDLTGAEVRIPSADEIERVLIVAPLLATYVNVVGNTDKIVGVHPICLSEANETLLDLTVANKQDIRTDFIKGYTSNTEEVLNMNPDIILLYGDFQKEGLENVDIPQVNFFMTHKENEAWSVSVDRLMREIFEVSSEETLQKEWELANEIVNEALIDLQIEDKKTAIMIRDNTSESITVRGANGFGDDWLKKTGLTNVAAEIQGDGVQVSMEQIYEWNPDVIYVFRGPEAEQYLINEVQGQDWSGIKAFEDKRIYDTPKGLMNWGAPNADSPITLMWMTMMNYPEKLDGEFYNNYMKVYYKRQYNLDLADELLEDILNPQK